MGRKLSECGQTGVMTMAGTLGCTMEPPAAAAYAVLPVGVAMIRPEDKQELDRVDTRLCACYAAGKGCENLTCKRLR